MKQIINKKSLEDHPEHIFSDKQFLQFLNDLAIKKEWEVLEKLCNISIKGLPPGQTAHPLILNMLSRSLFETKKFKKANDILQDILKLAKSPDEIEDVNFNICKCLYYLKRADEAIKLMDSFSDEKRSTLEYKIEYSLYQNAIGNTEKSKEILKSVIDCQKPEDRDSAFSRQHDIIGFNYSWFLFRECKFKEAFNGIVRGANLKVWGNEDEIHSRAKVTENKRWKFKESVDIIAFYLEGGIGDELVFFRYIQFIKPYANKVKIFCAPTLVNLLKECGYENVFPHADIAKETWDRYVPSMSSPNILELNDPKDGINFSYLVRKTNPVNEMNKIADGNKKICIKWRGNPEFEHDQFREFPIDGLLKLDKFGQLFSIQIQDNYDLKKNDNVWDLSHLINSWSDTYDIINESDLLVTSCSSVAHLAGIMGKKVIVLVPLVPYVTWSSDSQPWYPDNVTVVRQKEYRNWDSAFEELYVKVEEVLK